MQKMEVEQAMIQAITEEATEARMVAVQEIAGGTAEVGVKPRSDAASKGPKLGRPTLKQPSLYCSATNTQCAGTSDWR